MEKSKLVIEKDTYKFINEKDGLLTCLDESLDESLDNTSKTTFKHVELYLKEKGIIREMPKMIIAKNIYKQPFKTRKSEYKHCASIKDVLDTFDYIHEKHKLVVSTLAHMINYNTFDCLCVKDKMEASKVKEWVESNKHLYNIIPNDRPLFDKERNLYGKPDFILENKADGSIYIVCIKLCDLSAFKKRKTELSNLLEMYRQLVQLVFKDKTIHKYVLLINENEPVFLRLSSSFACACTSASTSTNNINKRKRMEADSHEIKKQKEC